MADKNLPADSQLLTCADCTFTTTSLRKLGRHRSVNHAGVKYRCEHCDFVTGYQSNYYRHRKQVHCGKETTHSCTKCDFSAQSNEGLVVHMSQMHREQYSCPECNLILNTKSQFQEHMRTFHGHKLGVFGQSDSTAVLASAYNGAALSALAASMNPNLFGNLPNPYSNLSAFGSMGGNMGPADLVSALLPAYMRAQLAMLSASALAASVQGQPPQMNNLPNGSLIPQLPEQIVKQEDLVPQTHSPIVKEENEPIVVDENENLEVVTTDDQENNELQSNDCHKCTMCRYETPDAARFKKHIRCHQTTAETECKQCEFKTIYSWNLDRHVRCHGVAGKYTCLRCSFSQNTRQSMTSHLQNHHNVIVHNIQCQTDSTPDDFPLEVDVGREPYIFEQHAVKYNADFQPQNEHSPAPKLINTEVNLTVKSCSASPNPISNVDLSRYLSEHEAIESPAEEIDTKDMESDPDIQNRTCSICGYQGKWISEMIRHKRVHTNERPFRCKYCSRTSKWKADLIRHLLKVHSIRVVSKYSRSKTFDSDPNVMRALKEAHGYVEGDGESEETLDLSMKHSLATSSRETSPSSSVGDGWMCCLCGMQSEHQETVMSHLEQVHSQPPFACNVCHFSCTQRDVVSMHVVSEHNFTSDNIVENIRPLKDHKPQVGDKRKSTAVLMQHLIGDAKRGRLEARGSISASTDCSSMGTGDSMSTAASPPGSTTSSTPEPTLTRKEDNKLTCNNCPFTCDEGNSTGMQNHLRAHEPPKGGLFYYKCTYCNWFAKKKHTIYEHLMLHTHNPQDSMHQVEKNLITQSNVEKHQEMPMDLSLPDASIHHSSILSDFGAILEAAGEEDSVHNPSEPQRMPSFYQTVSDATSDSEPDIEDEESYLHAGEDAINFTNFSDVDAPAEIQKVNIEEEGGSRKMWQCRFCPHVSKRRANVRMHEKKHFKPNPVGLLKCPKCNYRGDRRSLNAHYRVHSSVDGVSMPQRFPCSRCPANFRSETDLGRHLVFHGQSLDVKCGKCDYATKTDREMLLHSHVHSPSVTCLNVNVDEEEVDCDSSSSASLVSPVESPHRPSKPKKHACDQCPARFSDRTQLSRHSGFHSSGLSHQCPLCTYAVSFPINLNKHLRSHHAVTQQ